MIYVMRLGRITLAFLVFAAGCNKATSTAPTDSTATASGTQSDFFLGTLAPGGTQFNSFPLVVSATVTFTLVSLVQTGTSTLDPSFVSLTYGTPGSDGTVCTPVQTVNVTPALTNQISVSLAPGSYCVQVADTGGLSGSVDFAVRTKTSVGSVTEGKAGTETFSTNLYPGNNLTRTVAVGTAGDVNITLTQVTPAASIGFGIGVTKSNNGDCYLTKSVVSARGSTASLSVKTDPGTYCVKVFDPGTLPDRVTFFMEIAHQ